jgi:hypothetical protein
MTATLLSVAKADQYQPATTAALPVFGTSRLVIEVPFRPTHSETLHDSAAAENALQRSLQCDDKHRHSRRAVRGNSLSVYPMARPLCPSYRALREGNCDQTESGKPSEVEFMLLNFYSKPILKNNSKNSTSEKLCAFSTWKRQNFKRDHMF